MDLEITCLSRRLFDQQIMLGFLLAECAKKIRAAREPPRPRLKKENRNRMGSKAQLNHVAALFDRSPFV